MVFKKRFWGGKGSESEVDTKTHKLELPQNDDSDDGSISHITKNTAESIIRNQDNTNAKKEALTRYRDELTKWTDQISGDMEELDVAFGDAAFWFEEDKEKTTSWLYASLYTKLLFLITFIVTSILQKYPNNEIARKISRLLKGREEWIDNDENLQAMISLLGTLGQEEWEDKINKTHVFMIKWLVSKLEHIKQDQDYYINKLNVQWDFIEQLYDYYKAHEKKLKSRQNPEHYSVEIQKLLPPSDSEFDGIADIQEREVWEMLVMELQKYKDSYYAEKSAMDEKKKQLELFVQQYVSTLERYIETERETLVWKLKKIEEFRNREALNDHEIFNNPEGFDRLLELHQTSYDLLVSLQTRFSAFNVTIESSLKNINKIKVVSIKPQIKSTQSRVSEMWQSIDKMMPEIQADISWVRLKQSNYQRSTENTKEAQTIMHAIEQLRWSLQEKQAEVNKRLQQLTAKDTQVLFRDIYLNANDKELLSILCEVDAEVSKLNRLQHLWVFVEIEKDVREYVSRRQNRLIEMYEGLKISGAWPDANLLKTLIVYSKKKILSISDFDAQWFQKLKDEMTEKLRKIEREYPIRDINIENAKIRDITDRWNAHLETDEIKKEINRFIGSQKNRSEAVNWFILKSLVEVAEWSSKPRSMNLDLVQSANWDLYFIDHWSSRSSGLSNASSISGFYSVAKALRFIPVQSEEGMMLLKENARRIDQAVLYALLQDSSIIATD